MRKYKSEDGDTKTQAGKEAWAFICCIVSPSLPPVTTKRDIKAQAYIAFKVGKDFPQSRIDEAAQERCGWATKAAIENRARQLRLRVPDSPWLANTRPRAQGEALTRNTRESNDGDQIDILRAGAERLARSDPEFAEAYMRSLEALLARMEP